MKAKLLFAITFVSICFCWTTTNAQSTKLNFTAEYIHPVYQLPWYGEIHSDIQMNEIQFISAFTKQYLAGQKTTYKEVQRDEDHIGFTHIRYQQFNNDIEVHHGILIIHLRNNVVESFNGEIYKYSDAIPTFKTYDEILSSIESTVIPQKNYCNVDTNIFNHDIVFCPTADGNSIQLGYKFLLKSVNPIREDLFFINALNSKTIRLEPQLIHSDSVGKAKTYYRGTKSITTDFVGSNSFRLKENSRPINTYETSLGNYPTDTDNDWSTSGKEIAGDVHYGAAKVHEFMDSMFNWNSYANNGDSISSVLNYSGGGNAFWNLTGNYATFLVQKSGSVLPCASLDVVGHEFGHGIADENAGLVYTGESCMLHESFADITGSAVEYFEDSAKANWLLGDQVWVSTSGIRNMKNPKAFNHPDTYKGRFWGGGCHGNGGVQNYWFYLMLAGDTGTNDNGHQYDIEGLGRDSALQVMYRAMFYYVTPNTQFKDMATYTLKAAKDLYGSCGPELQLTWDAWKAVGIVDTTVNLINLEHGIVASSLRCTDLPATQLFTSKGDASRNVWWDFGGGDTANSHNLSKKFTAYGKRTIYLKTEVCNKTFLDTFVYRINPQPTARFDLNKTEFCRGYEDSLVATNTTLNLDKNQKLLYKWIVEPYDLEESGTDFKMQLKDKLYFFSIELETYYKTGCSSKKKEFVTPVNVAISDFNIKSACKNEIVDIVNLTDTARVVDFNWSFKGLTSGNTRTSIQFQPTEQFSTIEDVEVTLIMQDKATKCHSVKTDTISIHALPEPTFRYNKSCYMDTMTLINTTSHSTSITWFKWDFGFYEPFNKDTVTYIVDQTDSMNVGLEVRDDNQCKVKVFETLPIEYIQANFVDSVACQNADLTLQNNSEGDSLDFNWMFSDGTTSIEKSPIIAFDTAGKSKVSLTVFNKKCQSTVEKYLSILPSPQIKFEVEGSCVGSPTSFKDLSHSVDASSTYLWKFADGNVSSAQNPIHNYLNTVTETYFVNLQIENTNGCSNSSNQPVTINSLPHCGYTWSYTWPDRLVAFVPDSAIYPNYSWNFGDNSESQDTFPEHDFKSVNSFDVDLTITDKYGCSCTETKTVAGSNVSVNNIKHQTVNVYPNPNRGSFNINSSNGIPESLIVVDIHGKTLFQSNHVTSNFIETGITVPGVYFVTLNYKSESYVVPFIIQRD